MRTGKDDAMTTAKGGGLVGSCVGRYDGAPLGAAVVGGSVYSLPGRPGSGRGTGAKVVGPAVADGAAVVGA
jgi:hypothetical protein